MRYRVVLAKPSASPVSTMADARSHGELTGGAARGARLAPPHGLGGAGESYRDAGNARLAGITEPVAIEVGEDGIRPRNRRPDHRSSWWRTPLARRARCNVGVELPKPAGVGVPLSPSTLGDHRLELVGAGGGSGDGTIHAVARRRTVTPASPGS